MWEALSELLMPVFDAVGVAAVVYLVLLLFVVLGPFVGMVAYRRRHPDRSFVVGAFVGALVSATPFAVAGSSPPVVLGTAACYGVIVGVVTAFVAPIVREEWIRIGIRR